MEAMEQILGKVDAQMTGTLSWADFDAEVAETLDQMKKWEIRLMA